MDTTPMCKRVMFNLCEFVINDVMENVRQHFVDEGLDEIALEDFKGLWKEKLLETKAVDKIESKNTANERISKPSVIYRKIRPAKALINTTQESVVRPPVGKVIQPCPANNQISHQNASNNIQNQHLNYQRVETKSKYYYKLIPLLPANQVRDLQIQYVRNPVPTNSLSEYYILNNSGFQVGQQPQLLNQVSGQEFYSPTVQTIPGANNQHRFRNSNLVAGNHHYVPRPHNSTLRLPISATANQRHQNVIVRQLSNQHLVSTPNTQIPNNQNFYYYQQGLNQQCLTTNPSGTEFIGMAQNQVLVNTATLSNVASGVVPRQVRQSATAVRYVKNVIPTSTVSSQGNLNQISQPVGQGNLNLLNEIMQIDGGVHDEIDDELMSNNSTDDSSISFEEVVYLSDNDDAVKNTNEVGENDDTHDSDIVSDNGWDDDIQSLGNDSPVSNTNEIGDNVDNELDDDNEDDDEPPLNSDDDVSIESTDELFDSDNIIICQYEKVIKPYKKRRLQTWKLYLKDGFMFANSKEYVFKSALVKTTFLTYPW